MRKNIFLFASIILALCACSSKENGEEAATEIKTQTYVLETPYPVHKIEAPKGTKPKNVILMIGDGMSLAHIYCAWTANRGRLFLENCTATGLSITTCADKLITDSGAGATAMASGQKTNYHYIGMDTLGQPVKSIMTYAQEAGLSTGVAVTCRIWDATPASFCCHNIDRENEEEIIGDYPNCGVNYIFGGGYKLFENRKDGRRVLDEMAAENYEVYKSAAGLEQAKGDRVIILTDSVDTPLPKQRGDLLARAAEKGMELLGRNEKGYFMLIEGSQLDDYGHFNDIDLLMQETLDFDRTIGRVLDKAAADGETLVVVTADHETGGLTLVDGNLEEGRIVCHFSSKGHTGAMVPIYAFGPGAEQFTGIMENTEIFHKIVKLMGLDQAQKTEKQ